MSLRPAAQHVGGPRKCQHAWWRPRISNPLWGLEIRSQVGSIPIHFRLPVSTRADVDTPAHREDRAMSPSQRSVALSVVVGVLIMMTTGMSAIAQAPFKVGEQFPDTSFPSVADGEPMSVHDFRGQKVMLHVFASW